MPVAARAWHVVVTRAVATGPLRPCAAAHRRQLSTASQHRNNSCLVVGGGGALGRATVEGFAQSGWDCTSVDFVPNEHAKWMVLLQAGEAFPAAARRVVEELLVAQPAGFGAIVHAGGGWAGSDPGDEQFPESLDFLWDVNVKSAALAGHIAGSMLQSGGNLTLTGAAAAHPADGGTAGMCAYGMTKAATHHMMESLVSSGKLGRDGGSIHTILPKTMATPANLAAMPDAATEEWHSPADIAAAIVGWAAGTLAPPMNGAYVDINTVGGHTSFAYPKQPDGEASSPPK